MTDCCKDCIYLGLDALHDDKWYECRHWMVSSASERRLVMPQKRACELFKRRKKPDHQICKYCSMAKPIKTNAYGEVLICRQHMWFGPDKDGGRVLCAKIVEPDKEWCGFMKNFNMS